MCRQDAQSAPARMDHWPWLNMDLLHKNESDPCGPVMYTNMCILCPMDVAVNESAVVRRNIIERGVYRRPEGGEQCNHVSFLGPRASVTRVESRTS